MGSRRFSSSMSSNARFKRTYLALASKSSLSARCLMLLVFQRSLVSGKRTDLGSQPATQA
jgi:hypothetical protein